MEQAAPVVVIAVLLILALGFGPGVVARLKGLERAQKTASHRIDLGRSED